MELRHLRYFLAVADEQSFTRAAQRLGIGQPPLSQQIRDLEREMGVTLFHRLPRGAELTEAGQAFYGQVQGLPAQVEGATRAAQYIARGETGTLRIGFPSSAAMHPVVQASIRSFRRAFPNVDLTLEEMTTSFLVRRLEDRVLDVTFLRATAKHAEDFRVTRVVSEEMVAVVPVDHPLAERAEVTLLDLREEPFILTPRHVGSVPFDTVMQACRAAGFEPSLGQAAPQMLSVVSLVAAGLGVSVLPEVMRALQLSGSRFLRLRDAPVIELAVASRRDNRSKVLSNFLTHVLQATEHGAGS